MTGPGPAVLSRAGLDGLIAALIADGYRVIGPVAARRRDRAGRDQLRRQTCRPAGARTPAPGWYRLRRRGDAGRVRPLGGLAVVEAVPAPAAAAAVVRGRQRVHPARQRSRSGSPSSACARVTWPRSPPSAGSWAAARTPTTGFTRRRAGLFVIAAGCTEPGGVCFCASMGTGPAARARLRPVADRADRRRPGTVSSSTSAPRRARRVLAMIGHRPATDDEVRRGHADAVRAAADRMGRQMPDTDLARAAARQPRVAALGRDRRPLPDLRQLHDGLPDLLLHHDRGQHQPGR